MLAGRYFPSIDFIGVETADEGRPSEPEKMTKNEKNEKIDLNIFFEV